MNIALMLAAKALKEIKKIKADIGSTIQEYLSANPIETLVLDKKAGKRKSGSRCEGNGRCFEKESDRRRNHISNK